MNKSNMKRSVVAGLVVLIFLVGAAVQELLAQVGTSSILGYVYDPSGGGVPNARAILTNPATGFERFTQTNNSGYYRFPDLLPGTYNLSITQRGFKTYIVQGLVLQVDQQLEHNSSLQLGEVTQEVKVTGGAPELLETSTATTGQVIMGTTVTALPLNGRNFLQLASLGTGAHPVVLQGSASSFATCWTARSDETVHLGGNRESATSYLLDGIEARDDLVGYLTFQLSLDEIQEFKVQRNFFPAEYGFHPGIVNVATKAGTNDLHGAAWEFLRNDILDARNFFGSEVEPFHQNQFGATTGGPILKNKLFFFGDYEGFRKHLSTVQSGTYPDTNQFSGDLSDLTAFGNAPIFDPSTFDPVTGTRKPFTGNIVPSAAINPFSVKAAQTLFPTVIAPSQGGPNAFGFPLTTQTDNQFTIRLDGQDLNTFGKRTQMFGRFSYLNSLVLGHTLYPLGGAQHFLHSRNFAWQWNTSINPSTINVFRIGYQRDYSPIAYEGAGGSVNISQELGLKNTTTDPFGYSAPNYLIGGFGYTGGNFTVQNVLNRYIIADNLTHVVGAHTLKGGAEIRFSRLLNANYSLEDGFLTFSGQFTAQTQKDPVTGAISIVPGTGNPIADFLLGFPNFGLGAFGNTLNHFFYRQQAFFFQDDWKARPGLTLQLGLRYEPPSPPVSKEQRQQVFDFATGTEKFPSLGETPRSIWSARRKEFAPRGGFAWVPGFDKDSVWRGGFGIYFDQTQFNELGFESLGPPYFVLQSFGVDPSTPKPPFLIGQNVFPSVPASQLTPAPGYIPPAGTGPFSTETVMKTPTVYQWTLDYERSFAKSWLLEIGYTGLSGKHLSRRYDADQCSVPNSLICDPSVRPFPNLGEVLLTTNGAKSNMHSLNIRGERRFANGLSLLAAYTWAKSLDTDSGGLWGTPTERSACLNCDYGPSDFNIAHRFVTSSVWELPFGRGKRFVGSPNRLANLVVGGWQFTGIASFQTGPWYNILSTNATADSGINLHRGDCDIRGHGFRYASGDLRRNGMLWLNPANFDNPAPGYFGNCGRGTFSGPGLNNWDLALLKDFSLSERFRVEFRSEFFNAWNHAQFDLPNTAVIDNNAKNPNFGRISAAERPRVIQFGLKLYY